jgi:hypothetical protein
VVKAGSGGSLPGGVEDDDVDGRFDAFEGRGTPLALLGSWIMSKLARSNVPSRYRGWLAKTVIDNKSGRTRVVHEVRNPILRFAKSRFLSAAYSDTDNYLEFITRLNI